MTDLPPPSRDPLLPTPPARPARPNAAAPLPPPGSRTGAPAPSSSLREERLAALQARSRPAGGSARAAGGAGRGPVKAATVARWRRTWRARVIATTGAVAGVVGGTAVLAHSINADKVVEDASTATTPLESFDDTTTAVPAVTAPSVSVGTLPVTTPTTAATTTATTAAPATEATAPATEATVAETEATVPETEATTPTTRATRATTATTAARSQQRTRQQPVSRSSGS